MIRPRDTELKTSVEIDNVEEEVLVVYEFQPPEPDVGIMRSYLEIVGVYAREKDPVKLIQNRFLDKQKETFVVDITDKIDKAAIQEEIEESNIRDYY